MAGSGPAWRWLGWTTIAAVVALDARLYAVGTWPEATILAVFTLIAAGALSLGRAVPQPFAFAFAAAVAFAAIGWTWDLFDRVQPYDEIAHLVTSFALTPIVGFVVLRPWLGDWPRHPVRIGVLFIALSLTVGVGWEIVEWVARELTGRASFTPSLRDCITDLILDGMGATAATAIARRGAARDEADAGAGLASTSPETGRSRRSSPAAGSR